MELTSNVVIVLIERRRFRLRVNNCVSNTNSCMRYFDQVNIERVRCVKVFDLTEKLSKICQSTESYIVFVFFLSFTETWRVYTGICLRRHVDSNIISFKF